MKWANEIPQMPFGIILLIIYNLKLKYISMHFNISKSPPTPTPQKIPIYMN